MPEPRRTAVCPQPKLWAELHSRLREAAAENGLPPPPQPLLLNGWVFSNDIEKRNRWEETLAWAQRYGLSALLGGLAEESMYVVDQLSDYDIGPLGGPMHLPWNYDPKPKTDGQTRIAALEFLQANWKEIVGAELAAITSPFRLTGLKGRRLVVLVKTEDSPPWGSWTAIARDERRGAFTAFRSAVNRSIAPLEVDHIDFESM